MPMLKVNGRTQDLRVPDDTPLLYALRNDLKINSPKYGCGAGLCGACTVHIDGVALRSCQTSVSEVANKAVTTIEGLSADSKHPVQVAWTEIDVPQCGYCQSGQIMAAAALLKKKPKPTDKDIDAAMTNICRCGTYQRIREAVHLAAGSATTGSRT